MRSAAVRETMLSVITNCVRLPCFARAPDFMFSARHAVLSGSTEPLPEDPDKSIGPL